MALVPYVLLILRNRIEVHNVDPSGTIFLHLANFYKIGLKGKNISKDACTYSTDIPKLALIEINRF